LNNQYLLQKHLIQHQQFSNEFGALFCFENIATRRTELKIENGHLIYLDSLLELPLRNLDIFRQLNDTLKHNCQKKSSIQSLYSILTSASEVPRIFFKMFKGFFGIIKSAT
jgi:predicted signal transduction protein with EAL and GGDEF domain